MSNTKGSKHRNLVQLAQDANKAKEVLEAGGSVREMDHKNLVLRGLVETKHEVSPSSIALEYIRAHKVVSRDEYYKFMENRVPYNVATETIYNLKRRDCIALEGENLKFLKLSKAMEIEEFDNSLLEKMEKRVYTTQEMIEISEKDVNKTTIINRLLSMVKRGKIEAVGAGKWKLPGVEVEECVIVKTHRGDASIVVLDCLFSGVSNLSEIANRTGFSLNRVASSLNHLKKKGWVKIVTRGYWAFTTEGAEVYLNNSKEN